MKKFYLLLLAILTLSLSVFGFTACGGHKHSFDKQVVSADYLKQKATCESKALYFKSCECGEKGTETFESGEILAHKFTKEKGEKWNYKVPASFVQCSNGKVNI